MLIKRCEKQWFDNHTINIIDKDDNFFGWKENINCCQQPVAFILFNDGRFRPIWWYRGFIIKLEDNMAVLSELEDYTLGEVTVHDQESAPDAMRDLAEIIRSFLKNDWQNEEHDNLEGKFAKVSLLANKKDHVADLVLINNKYWYNTATHFNTNGKTETREL